MRLLKRGADLGGRLWTGVAALATFALTAMPSLFPHWYVYPGGRAPNQGAWLAGGLLAVSLLARFRPSRWLLLVTLPVLIGTGLFMSGRNEFVAGYRLLAFCAGVAWVALLSAPVRRYFRPRKGPDWGDAEAEPAQFAEPKQSLLSSERMEQPLPDVRVASWQRSDGA